jgi:hypothetical protein
MANPLRADRVILIAVVYSAQGDVFCRLIWKTIEAVW